MSVKIIPGTDDHMFAVADNFRQADLDEMFAGSYEFPNALLFMSWGMSEYKWAIVDDDVVVSVIGLHKHAQMQNYGVPWMLGTPEMDKTFVRRFFVRQSKKFIKEEMLSKYPGLINYVSVDNDNSIRWLKHCGFVLTGPIAFGPKNSPFLQLTLHKGMI